MTSAPPFHPLSLLLPPMPPEDFQALCADIKQHGQREPILLHQGLIIDGRHRWSACAVLGIKPRKVEWSGSGDLLDAVISLNVRRRHLTTAQRVEIALRLVETKHGANQYTARGKMTARRAADLLGISEDSVQRALKITRSGIPELQSAVAELGISLRDAAHVAALPAEEQQRIVNAGTLLRTVKRHETQNARRAEREAFQAQPFPPDEFDVILADPPWFYAQDNGMFRPNPSFHYPIMRDEELAELPVRYLARPHSMLFMWATGLTLQRALALMETWGFDYVTSGVWVKTSGADPRKLSHIPGLGPMLMTHELILIGRRGKGLGKTAYQPRSVFFAPGGAAAGKKVAHSRKPEVVHDWIERMWPATRKLELFARTQKEGWTTWGNEKVAAPKGGKSA